MACYQVRVFKLEEPPKLRTTRRSDICEKCEEELAGGYTPKDAVPEKHREVLQAAQDLLRGDTTNEILKAEIADQRNIVPTIAFAALSWDHPELRSVRDRFVEVGEDGEGWTRLDSELFLNRFKRIMPLGVLGDGTLVVRHVPVEATELLDDAGRVKELQLDVYTSTVTRDELVTFYERCLRRRELPCVAGRGDLGLRKLKDSVRILARPEHTTSGPVLTNGQGALPEPRAIGFNYQYLRTILSEEWANNAHNAPPEGVKKTDTKKPYNLIPACAYWYLGGRGAVLGPREKGLQKATRVLVENYLVEPCKDKFPTKIRKNWIRDARVLEPYIHTVEKEIRSGLS